MSFIKEEFIPAYKSIFTDKELMGLLFKRLRPYLAAIAGLAILIIVGMIIG